MRMVNMEHKIGQAPVLRPVSKSLKIKSSSVRLGKTNVSIAAGGNTIKSSFKLEKSIAQKSHLAKQKTKKLKVKSDKLSKAKAHALNSVKNAVKRGVNVAGAVVDKSFEALGKSDNETAQFANKSYDVAKMAGRAAVKTGRTVKRTVKTGQKLLTKKGRRGLAKSVKRQIKTAKRTVRNIKRAAKATAKAAKAVAKLAVKAAKAVAQLVTKVVTLIAETAPWSLIIIAVIALLILIVYLMTLLFGSQEEDNAAGLVDEDGVTDIYTNISDLEGIFAEVAKEKITDPLKITVTNFCGSDNNESSNSEAGETSVDESEIDDTEDSGNSQGIIEFNGVTYYPASAETVNTKIEQYIDSGTSPQRFASLVSTLKVLEQKRTGEPPEKVFTKTDFETIIGTVGVDTCTYGSTFFVVKTVTTTGETCPDEDCTTEYRDDDCKSRKKADGTTEYYCGGHTSCSNDHQKLTITLKTVEEYTSKSVPEIYGFDEDEAEQYESYCEFIEALIEEINDPESPNYNPFPPGNPPKNFEDFIYDPPSFSISSSNTALLILLVIGFIAFGIRKRGG